MDTLTSFFPVVLVGLVVSLLLSWPAAQLASSLGLVDIPGRESHKKHSQIVPIGGGMVLAASLAVNMTWIPSSGDGQSTGIALGGLIILVTGLLDDRFHLGVLAKLTSQLVAAGVLLAFGVHVSLFDQAVIDVPLTILWVVGVLNAFNFVDSMDGLALGLGGIAAAFFLLASIDSGQIWIASLCAAVLGASLGGFAINMLPSRSFLGDSGSQLLGFLLAAIGLAYIPLDLEQAASWYVPILVLGVPLFDTVLVVLSRLRRGRKVYQAGSDHTYHRLRAIGLESTRSVFAMHLAGITLGLLAFIGLGTGPVPGNALLACVAVAGLALLVTMERHAPPAD